MADLWEREIDHPLMHGPLNMVQMTLACALDFNARVSDFHWRPGHPETLRLVCSNCRTIVDRLDSAAGASLMSVRPANAGAVSDRINGCNRNAFSRSDRRSRNTGWRGLAI